MQTFSFCAFTAGNVGPAFLDRAMRRRISQAYPMGCMNEPVFVLCLLFPFFCSASSFKLSTSSTDTMLRGETLSGKTEKPVCKSFKYANCSKQC